jgi:hypothetical protein
LFKSGDKRNISNYHGIPILWAIPKLFEKLVSDVITPIISLSISDEQHGFVGGRSTVSEIEDGLQVDVVYTDFSKAYDRVNHGLLLGTLTQKFRGPMIFCMGSYLTSRTHCIRVGDLLSETIYCNYGVPQGHLGHLLFYS